MGLFDRYPTVSVALGILAGVAPGLATAEAVQFIAGLEFAHAK